MHGVLRGFLWITRRTCGAISHLPTRSQAALGISGGEREWEKIWLLGRVRLLWVLVVVKESGKKIGFWVEFPDKI